ncbi:unnamed protein product [Plasmodium vivax]|uniref:(malaria parasite P. vivax) hypothetical protein n=1 Tax=Plasmodium vivax TaxID=5855 RepID=A0A8S4H9A7_PLAVI|nr:unnamed protein product [Plasmodium vivax]
MLICLYPFLNNIKDLYDSFDKSVEGPYKGVYEAICENVTANIGDDKERYYPFCLKLIRNLDPRCENQEVCIPPSDRCNNVNIWLYNSKDKRNLDKKYIIERIFQLSGTLGTGNKPYVCPHYSYDENFEEPLNIIRLKIFNDNMEIIRNTLMSKGQQNYNLCQKYVCECANIYNKLNSLYCSRSNERHNNHQNTCDMLKALKNTYDIYLSSDSEISPKIPSLEATKEELLDICPSIQAQHSLQASVDGHSGSSTSKIPATIGTMAGVSSVFALLYKLTPAGRWINTGLRGSGGRINNSLYTNGADELILDGLEHNNFNAYNIGYEAS